MENLSKEEKFELIKKAVDYHGLTASQLSKNTNTKEADIINIFSGNSISPDEETVNKLFSFLQQKGYIANILKPNLEESKQLNIKDMVVSEKIKKFTDREIKEEMLRVIFHQNQKLKSIDENIIFFKWVTIIGIILAILLSAAPYL